METGGGLFNLAKMMVQVLLKRKNIYKAEKLNYVQRLEVMQPRIELKKNKCTSSWRIKHPGSSFT